MNRKDQPAFPMDNITITKSNGATVELSAVGMTIREYAAIAAMQGLVSWAGHGLHDVSSLAVAYADELMVALEAAPEEEQHGE